MIKSIKTLPSQISSIEVSDESDIESLGTEYGIGSTVRVTGQISAEYILTPDGWMKTAGGGAVPQPSDANPAPVGDTAYPGVSDDYARADHVHAPGVEFTPLMLTMVPTNPSNPLVGTWTGATWLEVQASLMSGRNIVASIPGVAYVKINSASRVSSADDWELSGLYVYAMGTNLVLIQSVLRNSGTYVSNIFALTPVTP